MVENKLKILALGAHPDDVELGCAGTVIKEVQAGKQVGIIDTKVGYTGDESLAHATYANHGSHAEAIVIEFDTELTSYRDILLYFFQIHDLYQFYFHKYKHHF